MVEKHYRAERHPAFYASALCITEKKLNLVCKSNAGINAGEYIRDRVLLEAKRLLHNADYTVKEIGYFLGFEDPSYFNRFFKANAGTTAVAFRKGQLEIEGA
jgi:AraC-like DNA-binding protein